MGENRVQYSGKRKDKGVASPKAERITKSNGVLI
jgi:hypothetical protein